MEGHLRLNTFNSFILELTESPMYMIKGLTLMTTLLLAQSAMLLDSSRSGKQTNNIKQQLTILLL